MHDSPNINHSGTLPARHRSPFHFLSLLTISIVVIEAFIMLLLSRIPPLSMPMTVIVDSFLLIVFLSPVLYFFLRRPLLLYIVELKQAEEEIRELATTERLTKLLNRFCFEKDEKELNNPVLLLVNIDGFSHINGFYGIETGDLILKEFAIRLKGLIPENLNAKIYKLGGDDFGVLFEHNPGFDPKAIAEKMVVEIEKKDFMYQDCNISLSISIGISRERPVLEKADMVLHYLKRYTRLKYREYSEELSLYKNISENMRVLNMLKKAISRDAVVSYFQPIVNNKTGRIEKYECLVRVIDEGGNVLSPFSFLQVAKEAKLYGEITKRMIERGVAAFKDNDYEFSINISVEDINDREIEEFMTMILKKSPEIACRTTFEIIESEGIENYEIVRDFIQKVKK